MSGRKLMRKRACVVKWLSKLKFWFILYSSTTRTYPFRLWKETGQGVAVIPKVDDRDQGT